MPEYTYKDVIIDPEDPRVEIGKEYYFGDGPSHLLWGVRTGWEARTLVKVCKDAPSEDPFYNGSARFQCIIRKKEPVKIYIPFNLSEEKDRAKLRGAWVKIKGSQLEHQIIGLAANTQIVFLPEVVSVETEELLENYEFVDGSPVGKLVEVGNE